MKKIISLISAIAMFAAISGAAMAVDDTPAVYVNEREIFFDDQEPVILGEGFTVIPARGVFEAMGATVTWDGDARTVEVESKDHNTLVKLTIDSDEMSVFDYSNLFATLLSGQDFIPPETKVKLDVPAQIMNDRTMIPLRAIGEALDATVEWNGEARVIDITTKDKTEVAEGAPELSLSASAETVAEGETIDVFVNVKNIPETTYVRSVDASVKYNPENFIVEAITLVNGNGDISAAASSYNPSYAVGCVKASYIVADTESAVTEDGKVLKITFKSINGQAGYFALANGYQTRLGNMNSIIVQSIEDNTNSIGFSGNNLAVDTTPVIVNAAE